MSDILRFLPTFVIVSATIWFVSFQINPYNVCDDDELRSDYYICQPLGFELKKGWLERSPENQVLDEQKKAYVSNKKSSKKETKKKIQGLCASKEYRESEEGLLNCGE